MSIVKKLQENIEGLQDIIDGKDLELRLLEGEMTDVFEPSIAISQTANIIFEMLMELNTFQKTKGLTPKVKASKDRLLMLLELNKKLSDVTMSNYNLKCLNRELHANYQMLRIENKTLKHQLANIESAENYNPA